MESQFSLSNETTVPVWFHSWYRGLECGLTKSSDECAIHLCDLHSLSFQPIKTTASKKPIYFVQVLSMYSGRSNVISSPLSKPGPGICQYMPFWGKIDNFYNCFLREVKCRNFLPFFYYSFWYSLRIVFQYYTNFKYRLWIFCSLSYFKSSIYAIILLQIIPYILNISVNLPCFMYWGFWDLSCSLCYDEHIRDYVENSLWF